MWNSSVPMGDLNNLRLVTSIFYGLAVLIYRDFYGAIININI